MMIKFILVLMFLFPIGLIAQNEMELDNAFEAYDNGEYEKALGLFNSIEKSNVKNAEFFLFRGICYSETDNDVKAISDYNTAIKLNNVYPEAYNQRGFSFFSQGNNLLAIKDFDKAIELNPEMAETFMNRGSAKYDEGNLRGACEDWKAAVKKGVGIAGQLVDQLCK
jgi:tetratricopeptide (TPR) repeat protein